MMMNQGYIQCSPQVSGHLMKPQITPQVSGHMMQPQITPDNSGSMPPMMAHQFHSAPMQGMQYVQQPILYPQTNSAGMPGVMPQMSLPMAQHSGDMYPSLYPQPAYLQMHTPQMTPQPVMKASLEYHPDPLAYKAKLLEPVPRTEVRRRLDDRDAYLDFSEIQQFRSWVAEDLGAGRDGISAENEGIVKIEPVGKWTAIGDLKPMLRDMGVFPKARALKITIPMDKNSEMYQQLEGDMAPQLDKNEMVKFKKDMRVPNLGFAIVTFQGNNDDLNKVRAQRLYDLINSCDGFDLAKVRARWVKKQDMIDISIANKKEKKERMLQRQQQKAAAAVGSKSL